jgi:hypothetical protein
MDVDTGFLQTCICGRTFSEHNRYNYHRRSCKTSKKRLSGALEKAKELWAGRKRRRIHERDDRMSSIGEQSLASRDLMVWSSLSCFSNLLKFWLRTNPTRFLDPEHSILHYNQPLTKPSMCPLTQTLNLRLPRMNSLKVWKIRPLRNADPVDRIVDFLNGLGTFYQSRYPPDIMSLQIPQTYHPIQAHRHPMRHLP